MGFMEERKEIFSNNTQIMLKTPITPEHESRIIESMSSFDLLLDIASKVSESPSRRIPPVITTRVTTRIILVVKLPKPIDKKRLFTTTNNNAIKKPITGKNIIEITNFLSSKVLNLTGMIVKNCKASNKLFIVFPSQIRVQP